MGRLSRLLGGVSIRCQAASAFEDADEQRILGALLRREFVIWQDARLQLGFRAFRCRPVTRLFLCNCCKSRRIQNTAGAPFWFYRITATKHFLNLAGLSLELRFVLLLLRIWASSLRPPRWQRPRARVLRAEVQLGRNGWRFFSITSLAVMRRKRSSRSVRRHGSQSSRTDRLAAGGAREYRRTSGGPCSFKNRIVAKRRSV
jgi:hypothetical protein